MKLLIVGSTGLVGRHVLDLALSDPRISAVVAPSRRSLPERPKLVAPVVDFEHLPEEAVWWHADAVICALGSTMRAAGSKEAFRRIDHDYPLAVARHARQHGTPTFVLNSAFGANKSSRFFYNRVKGELEDDLSKIDFKSFTFVRPGLIGGERDEKRPGEQFASVALKLLHPILPRPWRINPASQIARKMIEAALEAKPGRHVISSGELT